MDFKNFNIFRDFYYFTFVYSSDIASRYHTGVIIEALIVKR